MVLIIENWGSGHAERQRIGKKMHIDFHLPQQNRGVNGTLTNSLFKFPELSSSLALHLASALKLRGILEGTGHFSQHQQ